MQESSRLANDGLVIKLLVLNHEGEYDEWHKALPADLRANAKAELDIVVCLKRSVKLLENCRYSDNKSKNPETIFIIQRVQPIVALTLFTPSGTQMTQATILGGVPSDCPDTADGWRDSIANLRGADVSYDDFYAELTTLLSSLQAE